MYSVVGSDGNVYGPVDMATLSQWIAEGRIVATTNLIDPIDGRVIQAQQAPALYNAFPPPSSPSYNPTAYDYPRPGMMGYASPPKSKLAAILLAFFLGAIGIHRFYLGHTGTGVAMLALFASGFFTCGIGSVAAGIWALVDIVLIATGALGDANGRAMSQ